MNTGAMGRRAAELGTGFLTWKAVEYAFDYALYPFVIWKLGPWMGGVLMALLSLVSCLLLLCLYDRLGRDWLGLEFVKNLRHYDGSSRWRRGLAWLVTRGDLPAFLALSIYYDPFITTAYLRHGAFNGMTRRDWRIFLASWLIGNLLWIALCQSGVSLLEKLL